MSPNLFLVAKKAVTPWTWGKSSKSKKNETQKLYFSRQPVPAIYAITSKQKRHMVALRPNGKKDTENIFREFTSKEDLRLKFVDGIEMNTRTSPEEDAKNNPFVTFKEGNPSSEEDSGYGQNSTPRSSTSSGVSTNHCPRGKKPNNNGYLQRPSPLGPENRRSSSSSRSSGGGSSILSTSRPIRSVEEIMKTDGSLPNQISPFGRRNRNHNSHSLSSCSFSKRNYQLRGIEKIDLNGYKFLRHPLRIEYNQISKRWMFSSEVHERTIVVPMCRDLNCMAKDMSLCGKTIDRELFGLDDGESWIVVGKRGFWKGQEENLGQNSRLYCVDEKTECIRRQTVEEVKASRLRFVKEKGKILVCEDDAAYMPVMRYLEGKTR